jgi:hypothetical protein
VIYRVLLVILGVATPGALFSTISAAIGVVVVGDILLAYHGLILRQEAAPLPPSGRSRIPA